MHSFGSDLSKQIIQKVTEYKLYNHSQWHRLLHYKNDSLKTDQSLVLSPSFFISPNGNKSPKDELIQTIKGFLEKEDLDNPNKHAQCRFPARFLWIKQQLSMSREIPKVQCLNFSKWIKKHQADDISLILASGYLDNPASLYGHLLLKLNGTSKISPLLDTSINFGADTGATNNMISYIVNGIFGGYQGKFSFAEFYKNNMLYGEYEQRDLWEYKLNLSTYQVNLINFHIWELLNTNFQYYFFKENCALQIADVVSIALNVDLYNNQLPWVMPQQVVNALIQNDHVQETVFIPSRQSRFYHKYQQLSPDEKSFINDYIASNQKRVFLDESDMEDKSFIINTLFDYYAYTYSGSEYKKVLKKNKHPLLSVQAMLPVVTSLGSEPSKVAPDESQLPVMTRLDAYSKSYESGLGLEIRPAYFDSLNLNFGRPNFSSLSMLSFKLNLAKTGAYLSRVNLVKIASLAPSPTNIETDNKNSWKVRLGVEQSNLSENSTLTVFMEGSIGRATLLTKTSILSGFIGARLDADDLLSFVPSLTFISKPSKKIAYKFDVEYRSTLNKINDSHFVSSAEMRLGLNKEWDVRFKAEHNLQTKIQVSYALFW